MCKYIHIYVYIYIYIYIYEYIYPYGPLTIHDVSFYLSPAHIAATIGRLNEVPDPFLQTNPSKRWLLAKEASFANKSLKKRAHLQKRPDSQ